MPIPTYPILIKLVFIINRKRWVELKMIDSDETQHLKHYNDLRIASNLFGDEYTPIFKTLWYQLLSFKIRTAELRIGRNKTDGRINALYPLKAGHGKGELKRVIKDFIRYFNMEYSEPTSLHAEQLVGKVVKKPRSEEYLQRLGYLARDWLVIDEAYNLLSSNELHYSEARKYIRTALDRYPGNTIHKETTDIGSASPLEYDPYCPISLFIQPKRFESDILVLEGDLRRVVCPYVNMTGVDKVGSYEENIFNDDDDRVALDNFCAFIDNLTGFEEFTATDEAKSVFLECFLDLIDYGTTYNDKIRNFTDIIGYTLQTFLLKFSAVQALQDDRNLIISKDVLLAHNDLLEILTCTFTYVNKKVPGFLNYGEGWQGAEPYDQEVLEGLHKQGATSEDRAVQTSVYVQKIMDTYRVKDRRAREIIKQQQDLGWIQRKRKTHSKVWITFTPNLT